MQVMEQNKEYVEQLGDALEGSDEHSAPDTRMKFHIDTSRIKSVPVNEQNDELQNLDLQVYNQDTFEQG